MGRLSSTPDEDLPKAIVHAQTMLDDCKTFFEASIKTRKLQDKLGSASGLPDRGARLREIAATKGRFYSQTARG